MISKNQIKQIQSLHLKKNRDDLQLFLAEGAKLVKELLAQYPERIHEVFGTAAFIDENRTLLNNAKINCCEVKESELERISAQKTPNQALALCKYFSAVPGAFDFERKFSLYLDDIRDPGNFGTIIRLASWFGISSIFCSETSCDIYNPKVIQSTMGAFTRVQVVYCSLSQLIGEQGVKNVYGAVLNGKSLYGEKLGSGIIVIGNEANGIGAENLQLVNRPITIPSHLHNATESLNAAMASAIITSEFFRQTEGNNK
jgi:RNA methyltransferase, TrmH family